MTMPMCEDGGLLREWTPLTAFLQRIPAKIQNGIFTQDISLTCIDAVPEFIAVGTNHGLIYWYDREKQDLQRLRCENANGKITRVRITSTVDYMVAAGNDHGIVTVFQIPKNPPDSLPDSLKPKQKKQVERYTISGLHKSAVTAVEWSKNGMKLFSGDQEGLVVLTEIDFYMHISKSSELLNEKYSVVQLSYLRGLLLVSTTLRTILVNRNENNKVTQVGQKERKLLAKLGATFAERQCLNPQDAVIYASRPGLRLWQADRSGTVSKTLIFKDAIQPEQTRVKLLNPAPETARKSRYDPTFGIVLPFSEELLVTYSEDVVYVVDPRTIVITSVISDARRVCDVACTKEEIFILEGDRNLIRVAYGPDVRDSSTRFAADSTNTTSFMDPITTSFTEIGKPVAASIFELTSKFKESAIVPAIPVPKIDPSNIIRSAINPAGVMMVAKAEEALEISPAMVPPDLNNAPLTTDVNGILEFNDTGDPKASESNGTTEDQRYDRRMIFQKIGEQEFEDVVFTPERRTKKARKKKSTVNGNGLPPPPPPPPPPLHSSDVTTAINLQRVESRTKDVRTKTTHSSLLTLSTHDVIDDFVTKSERNLDTLRRDVESKEKLLADVLDFDLSKYTTNNKICRDEPSGSSSGFHESLICNPNYLLKDLISEYNSGGNNDQEESRDEKHFTESSEDEGKEDTSYRMELKKLEELGECRKQLLRDKLIEPFLQPLPTSIANNDVKVEISDVLRTQEVVQQATAKECITTTMTAEEEGWVFVKNIYV